MQNILKITFVQTDLFWENIEQNIEHFNKQILEISEPTDVIVLPEMFSTAFSMNTAFAEEMNGKSMQWMAQIAKQKNVAICGSIMTAENDKFYNRFVWMNVDGTFECYDKRHCFRMANENDYFTGGNHKIIINYKGFKICPMVCYDLRFPVWSRNRLVDNNYEYDVLLYVANWPQRREYAWQQLLIARAIENVSFVVGVNRVGSDGHGFDYSGLSVALDMLGQPINTPVSSKKSIQTIALNKLELENFRIQFPALLDADSFNLQH